MSITLRTFTILLTYKTYTMQQIKKITERTLFGAQPFVIEKILEDETSLYQYRHYNEVITVFMLEQTVKGVYMTIQIAGKGMRLFMSNTDIEIEYED